DTAALQGVSVRLGAGQLVVLMGPSGSGKSTLLGILAGLDRPDEGLVSWEGRPLDEISEEESAGLRATWLGMVFQALGLLPSLSAQENVALPLLMAGVGPGNPRGRGATCAGSTVRSGSWCCGTAGWNGRVRPARLGRR